MEYTSNQNSITEKEVDITFISRKSYICILSLAFILFLTGCLEKVPLSVTNELENYNIQYVYISRGTDHVWGTNHLPETDLLEPGKTAEVMVRPGVYDLQVIDEDGDTYTLIDIRIGSDGFNWTVALADMDEKTSSTANILHAGQCPFTITNNLDNRNVNGIWISLTNGKNRGDNHLGGEILYPGDTYTAYVQSNTYNIYLEDHHGDTYTRRSTFVDITGHTWNVRLSDSD